MTTRTNGLAGSLREGRSWRALRFVIDRPSVRAAWFPFIITRFAILTIFVLGGHASKVATPLSEGHHDLLFDISQVQVTRVMREVVSVGDVNWYQGIAVYGYHAQPFSAEAERNWAFFPIFPLIWRAGARLTGEYVWSGLFFSNFFFFLALVFLYETAISFGYKPQVAKRAAFFLCIFPTSYFFSVPLPESLFLFLSISAFYWAQRDVWWAAGLFGAIASGTRGLGVLLLPVLALMYLLKYRRQWLQPRGLWLMLVPAGLVSFMIYLYWITGNAFAFKDILQAWHRHPSMFYVPLGDFLNAPWILFAGWDFKIVNFAVAVVACLCGMVLLRDRKYVLGLWVILCELVSLSSTLLQSQARYATVLFPVFFVLAQAAEDDLTDRTLSYVFITLLTLFTTLYSAHFVVAFS